MKRRTFLSTSAFAGAFAITPNFARAAASANGDLRVCVIGFHSRGKHLANEVLKSKGAKVVALCDVDSDVLDGFAAELEKKGVKVAKFEDYREVCESKDIDAVVIATPNHLHTLIATTAAANGKHAYVEKPVSHNVWEGRQLADAQEKYKTVIQHGFQRRSEDAWHEAYDFVKSGELGKTTIIRGFCYKPRPSIGKVAKPLDPPKSVNYDLWCGPRECRPRPAQAVPLRLALAVPLRKRRSRKPRPASARCLPLVQRRPETSRLHHLRRRAPRLRRRRPMGQHPDLLL